MMDGGFGMGGLGFLGFLVTAVILMIPFWVILPKFGLPSWASAAAIIPIGNFPVGAVILLWLMAFKSLYDERRSQ